MWVSKNRDRGRGVVTI